MPVLRRPVEPASQQQTLLDRVDMSAENERQAEVTSILVAEHAASAHDLRRTFATVAADPQTFPGSRSRLVKPHHKGRHHSSLRSDIDGATTGRRAEGVRRDAGASTIVAAYVAKATLGQGLTYPCPMVLFRVTTHCIVGFIAREGPRPLRTGRRCRVGNPRVPSADGRTKFRRDHAAFELTVRVN
jgi:hypothetical protein